MSRRPLPTSRVSWLLPLLVVLLVLAAGAYVAWRQQQPPATPNLADGVGWQVFFTTPRIPDDPALHRGGLDERLVELMDRAGQSLDVAIYDLDLENVALAMARAAGRGARVRLVTDTEILEKSGDPKIQAAYGIVREAGIPIVSDNRQAIMHHKFAVADGQVVATGSWNFTDGDTYRLNNNLAVFVSPELAQNYTAEFEKMFLLKRFGRAKTQGVPFPAPRVPGLGRVENLFAPQDDVGERIVELISRAERTIHFLAFSFTHDAIGRAMRARAEAGVAVQGVFERTGSNTQFSEYAEMKRLGLEVYQDGSPYVMHHKVILIDNRVTLFGSFNFSANADTQNDENVLIVEDPRFTAEFEQEFQRMLALAKNPPPRR